jgi:DNA-nicking Smr family endonuclease
MVRRLRDEDQRLWHDAMRGVKPLRRAHPSLEEEQSPIPRQPERKATDIPLALSSRGRSDDGQATTAPPPLDRRMLLRIKRGEMAIGARLDLHGMTQEAAHRALARFIAEAAGDDARLALVITGKGRGGEGILRAAVPRWLNEPALRAQIVAIAPAPPQLGGSGALCVRLRRSRERIRP